MISKDMLESRHKILLALKLFEENAHEIIDIVFESENTSDCVEKISNRFGLNKEQSQVIADCQIKTLSQLRREDLSREITEVEALLAQKYIM